MNRYLFAGLLFNAVCLLCGGGWLLLAVRRRNARRRSELASLRTINNANGVRGVAASGDLDVGGSLSALTVERSKWLCADEFSECTELPRLQVSIYDAQPNSALLAYYVAAKR